MEVCRLHPSIHRAPSLEVGAAWRQIPIERVCQSLVSMIWPCRAGWLSTGAQRIRLQEVFHSLDLKNCRWEQSTCASWMVSHRICFRYPSVTNPQRNVLGDFDSLMMISWAVRQVPFAWHDSYGQFEVLLSIPQQVYRYRIDRSTISYYHCCWNDMTAASMSNHRRTCMAPDRLHSDPRYSLCRGQNARDEIRSIKSHGTVHIRCEIDIGQID